MKVVIFGASGQLGLCLQDQFKGLNSFSFFFYSRRNIDILDFPSVRNKINSLQPDIIINAAAYTNVDEAEDNQEIANLVNNLAVKNIADLCCKNNITLIHISTDYVFDGKSQKAYSETDEPNPISEYGKSKLMGEKAIIKSNCSFIIIRTSWVYSEYGNNFLKTMTRIARENTKIRVINDQFGCPTYAQDISKAIILIIDSIKLKNCKWGIYHFCGDTQNSWFDFAKLIFIKINKYNEISLIPIPSSEYVTKAIRPKFSTLDCSKYKLAFGGSLSNVENGIIKTLNLLNMSNK